MRSVPYTNLARQCLTEHAFVTSKMLDDFIIDQGYEPKPSMSIASLAKLAQSGEASKTMIKLKGSRIFCKFTATPLLGNLKRANAAPQEYVVPEGVLMLQSILGNMAVVRGQQA